MLSPRVLENYPLCSQVWMWSSELHDTYLQELETMSLEASDPKVPASFLVVFGVNFPLFFMCPLKM